MWVYKNETTGLKVEFWFELPPGKMLPKDASAEPEKACGHNSRGHTITDEEDWGVRTPRKVKVPKRAANWFYGDCYYFAMAAHKLTGWPIVCYGTSNPESRDGCVWHHLALQMPNGNLFDASGEQTLEQMVDKYKRPDAVTTQEDTKTRVGKPMVIPLPKWLKPHMMKDTPKGEVYEEALELVSKLLGKSGTRLAGVKVFHGTPVKFEDYHSESGVYYFTDNTEYAKWFANPYNRGGFHHKETPEGVVQVYDLDLKKPFDARKVKNLTWKEYAQLIAADADALLHEAGALTLKKRPFWWWFRQTEKTSKNALQEQGYDGIIQKERTAIYGSEAKANSYVAFSPTQFKKTAAEEFNLDWMITSPR